MISSVHNTALSALRSFSTGIQSNANNIANMNTDGYKKTRVLMAETENGGVEATVDKVNSPGPVALRPTDKGQEEVELSNVDLAEEMPDMILNENLYKANLKTVQVENEMIGNLLDMKA